MNRENRRNHAKLAVIVIVLLGLLYSRGVMCGSRGSL
jgi:hypothetical protein